ncbi:unnamed protein product, partial [marine sediment metagenome]
MNKTLSQLKKQAVLTVVVLTILTAINFNILISPTGTTTNRTILFEWIGLADTILVDDNPSFTSPIKVQENTSISLPPGEYYWRTTGLSTKRRFKIDSEVAI